MKWHVRLNSFLPRFTSLESSSAACSHTELPLRPALLSPHLCLYSSGWAAAYSILRFLKYAPKTSCSPLSHWKLSISPVVAYVSKSSCPLYFWQRRFESCPIISLHLRCGDSGKGSRGKVRASERSERAFEPGGMQRIKLQECNDRTVAA